MRFCLSILFPDTEESKAQFDEVLMRLGSRQFSPGLWPTMATFSILPLLLYLGFWQLDRAEQKTALHQHYAQRSNEAPVESIGPNIDIVDLLWRRAVLSGSFNQDYTFLLDNQVLNRQPGYYVYSLFKTDIDTTLLVNRGWIRAGTDRWDVPGLATPGGRLKLSGVIKPAPATGWLLAKNTDEKLEDGLYRLQQISPEEISRKYQLTLPSYVLRLDAESTAGYVRDWQQPASGKEKHLGYAFQWFAMASALLIIFLTVNLKKSST